MDYDINNQQALTAGAFYRQQGAQQQDWRSMDSAPKDGTIIEIRCTYGIAPWFGLFRWTGKRTMTVQYQDGRAEVREMEMEPTWVKAGDDQSSVDGTGSTFTWRPYSGDVAHYVDPTGGMQASMAYWRGAAAASRGLPLDYFEKEVAANTTIDPSAPKRSFWQWLFGRK